MNILAKSENLSDREVFRMTEEAGKFNDNKGRTFDMDAYVLYEDVDKKTGEMKTILTIRTDDGDVIGTNSATVIGTFKRMVDALGFPIANVQIIADTNRKSGREFLNLHLAD